MVGLATIAAIAIFTFFKFLDSTACEWREPKPTRCAVEQVVELEEGSR